MYFTDSVSNGSSITPLDQFSAAALLASLAGNAALPAGESFIFD